MTWLENLLGYLSELKDTHEAFNISMEEAFSIWFLMAYVDPSFDRCRQALVDGPNDKGLDAIFIDHENKAIVIAQSKLRRGRRRVNENRQDVISFADIGRILLQSDNEQFKAFVDGMDKLPAGILEKARNCIKDRKYRLDLYFVTTGGISAALKKEAQERLRAFRQQASVQLFDEPRMRTLLHDYLNGAAPPVPYVKLVAANNGAESIHEVRDHESRISSYTFAISGEQIGNIFKQCGVRIFARNIRGFLGKTQVNKDMEATLSNNPEMFLYLNNGITIVCDRVEQKKSGGEIDLELSYPQIINGQQTTRTLAEHIRRAKLAKVLVRIFEIPREDQSGEEQLDKLIADIVAGTNWQNSIKESDLRATDATQVELERKFRKLGVLYIRKRQTKSEARNAIGVKGLIPISKEDLAQSVAACEMDQWFVRSGRDNLFKYDLYNRVFPNMNPYFYLPRYGFVRLARRVTKGHPNWGYAKWMVSGVAWKEIGLDIRKRSKAIEVFRCWTKGSGEVSKAAERYLLQLFRAAEAFYKGSAGVGAEKLDVSQFYRNRKGRNAEFAKFLRSHENKRRALIEKAKLNLEESIEKLE